MNNVKITSGKYRGRTLLAPGGNTHPMGAREKLALFNMITPYLPDAIVLDAYAGSGALGIEVLSRGAGRVTFIEKNPKAAQIIRQNLTNLGLEAEVFQGRTGNYQSEELFDVILADPPYDDFDLTEVISLAKNLAPQGVFVLSHPGDAPEIPSLELNTSRKYAGATISIYLKQN